MSSHSIPASILTAAYLGPSAGDVDHYMTIYNEFLSRLESAADVTERRFAHEERARSNMNYQYKRST